MATQIPTCSGTPNGTCIDPNMLALANLFPGPNATPNPDKSLQLRSIRNFQPEQPAVDDARDYNISDNTKVFVRYNYQREIQLFPVGLWWRNGDQVPYPTRDPGQEQIGFMVPEPSPTCSAQP